MVKTTTVGDTPAVEANNLGELLKRLEKAEARAEAAEKLAAQALQATPRQFKGRTEEERFAEIYDRKVVDANLDEKDWPYNRRDVVRLVPTSPKFKLIKGQLEKRLERNPGDEECMAVLKSMVEGTGPRGEIEKYMYTSKKDKDPKYKVKFPGIGRDGCKASELELVRQAQ